MRVDVENSIKASAMTTLDLGPFQVERRAEHIQVIQRDAPERVLWRSASRSPLVRAARGRAQVTESRGFFKVDEQRRPWIDGGGIDRFEFVGDSVVIEGPLGEDSRWSVSLTPIDESQLRFSVSTDNAEYNRVQLVGGLSPEQRVFGFGEQFTHLDIKGRVIPVLSQEPGIGRGVQPLSWFMNQFFGAAGEWHTSNAPAPWYLTTDLEALCLESYEYSVFDFSHSDRVEVTVFAASMTGRVFAGGTPAELVEAYTRFSGRMPCLPSWINQGAVIGMQGGTEAVRQMSEKLREVNAPVAAFWLQDWVGARRTSIGWQLWWNWELDEERYPDWDDLLTELRADGARVMTYLNPFLVDASEKGSHRRNLYQEALEQGFLVQRRGQPYQIMNTSFSAAMVDFANPAACEWMKRVITEQLIASGASGWMADFGEALPFDAELFEGADAAVFHNQYPEEWARINREAVSEAGLDDEIVFFMRSGYSRSPRYNALFWMGDQLTSWSRKDGIKSTVIALLSSGLSGFSLNHSDIGGYIATTLPRFPIKIPGISYTRSRELLHRWIELNAFTPVFRTHEGNQPGRHFQIDGDRGTLEHFARFARVFAALAQYRQALGEEAAETGLPLVRHPWLQYPDDPVTQSLELQFMLGPQVMVAPTLDGRRTRVELYLPAGSWRHLWSGELVDLSVGAWFSVASPPGAPAVFFHADAPVYEQVRSALDESNDLVDGMTNLFQAVTRA